MSGGSVQGAVVALREAMVHSVPSPPAEVWDAFYVLERAAGLAAEWEPFSFAGELGRHNIQVDGERRPGAVRVISIRCLSCDEQLLKATKPTLALALAAVENHG